MRQAGEVTYAGMLLHSLYTRKTMSNVFFYLTLPMKLYLTEFYSHLSRCA
jgi:hypothetical protein